MNCEDISALLSGKALAAEVLGLLQMRSGIDQGQL